MKLRREDGGAKAVQEAEFAVLSSIAVREQHKAKLRLIINPPDTRVQVRAKSLTKKVKSPEVAEGLEIHVLGDLLLLTRAASVDVVEKIQAWRDVVHRGIPRPYIYDKENYLLSMCEDVDFLDEVGDLVEWLGFRLARNPFIANEALDDVVSPQLGIRVHDGRSLKYWHSASWQQNNKLVSRQNGLPTASKLRQRTRDRWKKQPPPRPLVKPLASISPEDDVVDGSRIAAAQEILLEEESLHGRLRALKTAHEYVDRGPSIIETGDVGNNAEAAAVYDAIAIVNSKLKKVEFHSSLLRRERGQVERMLQDLNSQVKWTEFRRDCDRTKDYRVWHFRDTYRQEALKAYTKLAENLQSCLTVLNDEDIRFQRVLDMHADRMRELRLEKDNQRAARHEKKRKEEAARRQGIGKRIQERGSKLRAKKKNLKKHRQTDSESPSSKRRDSSPHEDILLDIQSDIRVLVGRKSSSPDRSPDSLEKDERQLEEKRQTAIYQKRARLEQQTWLAQEKKMALDRRRAENVAMKWEDALSRTVEREGRRRARLRTRKAMLERVESCAIFKCTHEMNGKRFLISVYTRNARGYELEGLRIVAYDPISSAAFTMAMTLREFNSLGYGGTSEGLGAFCKWLCLLYEKRRRQFRLVWSGAPCPPPLRVRENDQALVCIHKEGVKMRRASADSFALVAVYLRTDNRSIVRFVVGAWHGHEFLLTEHAVEARDLIIDSDLDVQWKASGHPTIVWKHNADAFKSEESNAPESLTSSIGMRVYSSEIVVNRVRYSVHVHDTNESEYTVELIPKPKKDKHAQAVIPSDTHRLILHKRQINPYDVHLSSSSFADLLSLIRFEQIPSRTTCIKPDGDGSDDRNSLEWKATVSPKWAGKLANYVRVFRLAKYACKVGGVFCFVTASVVQQKTEFRAHLLLEVTWLPSTLSSSSSSLGGVESRQLIRIPLSEYLRCANVSRRFTAGLGYGKHEGEDEGECTACLTYTTARARFYDNDAVVDTTFDYSTSCSNCATIQYQRLHAIKELAIHSAPESLELIYHAYCEVCTRLAPPVVLVLGSAFSGSTPWLLPLLGHYFTCFDCDHYGLFKFVEGDEGHAISEESIQVRDIVLQTLTRDQIIVIYNADCGVTVASANLFVNELHWWLYPDCSELPCHVAFILTDDLEHETDILQRDFDLLEALRALNQAACQLAELDSVRLDDVGGEGTDRASAFDAYLVAEAVLVEATRVLLHPDYAWQKPRKIVGASSWSSACSFLLDPVQLSAALQRCDPLQLSATTIEVLDAYFMHAKWPLDNPNVRPFFHGLLAFMMHVQHVRQLLALRSGSLQGEMTRNNVNDGETTTSINHETLAQSTSVLNISHQVSNHIK